MLKTISRIIMAVFYIAAGSNHFRNPKLYLRIMPPWLPQPKLINWVSGGVEIILGILLFVPRMAKSAAWGVIALLIAVFPANVNMLIDSPIILMAE